MKKFRTMFIINQLAYWGIYGIKTFIIWEWTNPFQWMIDIPTYSDTTRFMIIFYILFGIACEIAFAIKGLTEEGKIR